MSGILTRTGAGHRTKAHCIWLALLHQAGLQRDGNTQWWDQAEMWGSDGDGGHRNICG